MTNEDFDLSDQLADGEDSSSVAAMAIAVRSVVEVVHLRIGQLMAESEDDAAINLRDHAQMLAPAAALLDRLYSELESTNDE